MAQFLWPPAGSGGSGSNASVGTNGATAPTSSTEVAGVNPSGNLQPLQTDASGNLLVNINAETGAPFHVIVDSSALPTGASTSALQVSGNSQLVTIASNQTNGTQVTAVNNFPATQPISGSVSIADSVTGTKAQVGLSGALQVSIPPTQVFNESFEGGVIDTTNRWNAPVVAGAGAVTQGSTLGLVVSVGTGANSAAALSSQPTFPTQYGSQLAWATGTKIETTTIATGNYRFFGLGTPGTAYSTTNPIANGIGFEITTAGILRAVIYASDVLVYSSNLTVPVDGAEHVYLILSQGNFTAWYLDNTSVPVATSLFQAPDITLLPIRYASLNAGSTTVGTPTMTAYGCSILDVGRNATQLSDGTYPWRRATISSGGLLSVTDANLELTVGSKAAGTAATSSQLVGMVYNSTTPAPTNGQQLALQSDLFGNLGTVNPDIVVTGQSAQTATVNNILTVASGSSATDLLNYRTASIQVVSTGTGGTFIFEGSNDNSNFQTLPVWSQLILTGTPVVAAVTATASQLVYTFPVTTRYVRLRIATTITGGSIQAFSRFSQATWAPPIRQIAQATAANLNATVTATNLSTNVAQINAVTPLMGNGVTGTGSLRVTIASDTTSNTNAFLVAQAGRTSANTPTFNTNSGANITTAAYLQLVASTTSACKAVEVYNQTSSSIYFATGAAASEVNQFIIPPGGNGLVSITIASATRISVKAVDVTASTGSLIVNYWT